MSTLTSEKGFSLIEVVIASALLLIIASGISFWSASGYRQLDAQKNRMLLTSKLRSRMEALVSTPFDQLSGSSEAVTVGGEGYTITWTAANADLDGDAVPEPYAMLVNVSVPGITDLTLSTIIVKHNSLIQKTP